MIYTVENTIQMGRPISKVMLDGEVLNRVIEASPAFGYVRVCLSRNGKVVLNGEAVATQIQRGNVQVWFR